MPPKRRKQNNDTTPSPLHAKQQELDAQQAKVREEIERRERLIEKAPEIAEKQAKMRRDQLITRAGRNEVRAGVALPDPRHVTGLNANMPARPRRLRSERNQGRLMFFALVFTLLAALYWAYYTFTLP